MRGIRQSISTAAKPWPSARAVDRLDAVDGDLGGVADALEQSDGDHLVDLVVLDDQHPLRARRPAGREPSDGAAAPRRVAGRGAERAR